MTYQSIEPSKLRERLEQKFVRKVYAEQSRRRVRNLRRFLTQMDGISISDDFENLADFVQTYE